MILPKSNRLTPEQLAAVTAIVAEFGCTIQPIIGAVRTIYAIVGDERDDLMINRLEGLAYVERIDRIQSPFKLMDKRSDLASHRITLGRVTLGERLLVIAGNCTIDPKNPNHFYETAAAVKEAGADMIRGGVWKPRTNPYSFQGDVKSLDILMEGARRTGLPVDTEAQARRESDLLVGEARLESERILAAAYEEQRQLQEQLVRLKSARMTHLAQLRMVVQLSSQVLDELER